MRTDPSTEPVRLFRLSTGMPFTVTGTVAVRIGLPKSRTTTPTLYVPAVRAGSVARTMPLLDALVNEMPAGVVTLKLSTPPGSPTGRSVTISPGHIAAGAGIDWAFDKAGINNPATITVR